MQTKTLAPIGAEILLRRGSAQKIAADSGIKLLKIILNLKLTFLPHYRHEIMKIAKITDPVTYHRCIKDLSEYGYINYVPKKNRNQKSVIYFPV